jgi:hypothetical protein
MDDKPKNSAELHDLVDEVQAKHAGSATELTAGKAVEKEQSTALGAGVAKIRGHSRVTFSDKRKERRLMEQHARRLARSGKWNEKFLEALMQAAPVDPSQARLHRNIALRIAGLAHGLGLDPRKLGKLAGELYPGLMEEVRKATGIVIGAMRDKVLGEEAKKQTAAAEAANAEALEEDKA